MFGRFSLNILNSIVILKPLLHRHVEMCLLYDGFLRGVVAKLLNIFQMWVEIGHASNDYKTNA